MVERTGNMSVIHNPLRWCTGAFWGVLLLAAGACTPPPFEFTLTNNYQRENFSGRDVAGRTIGCCMLLTDTGVVTAEVLPSKEIVKKIRSTRPDLNFKESDSVYHRLGHSLVRTDLQRFRSLLYKGDLVALQALDTVWRAVGYDYLFVLRLRRGMHIKTFNQMMRKRFLIEAELWDCREIETVWRVIIDGKCSRPGITDRRFLLESLESVISALPAALPAYDSKSW